ILIKAGTPIPLAVAITILIGIFIGSTMGFIISYIKINPFIVTLSGFLMIRSLHLIISGGTSIGNLQKPFALIARFKILNIPMYIIFAFFSILVFDVLLRNNVFFRNNYNLGGDEGFVSLIGINVKRLKLFNYCLTGAMASIAGIFIASKFNNANIEGSPDTAFQVITAVILGGASLKGGRGSVTGTLLGLCIMALIQNALVLFGLNIIWNKVAIGLILIIVVVLDSTMNRKTLK
ncbi:MAG: ABC transporter permease, partial [Actinobacteria bacterium]|nr:ABC transporter permease [Actinomycetota bacterium]